MSDLNIGKVLCHTFSSIYGGSIKGRQLRMAYTDVGKRQANTPLEMTHLDVFGRMEDVVFIDNSTSNWSELEMRQSGRNKAPGIIGMAKSSKSPSFGEWWKNHIMHQYDVERVMGASLNDYLKFFETMSFENMVIANDRKQSLPRRMNSHSFDYSQSGNVEGRALGCL